MYMLIGSTMTAPDVCIQCQRAFHLEASNGPVGISVHFIGRLPTNGYRGQTERYMYSAILVFGDGGGRMPHGQLQLRRSITLDQQGVS